MGEEKRRNKKAVIFVVTFLVVNLLALSLITMWESVSVNRRLTAHAEEIGDGFDEVMDSYEQSFKLFAQMMGREIQNNPNPDILWDYLKSIDAPLLAIEGETFDGLYMYYQGRYLYSWDKPYSAYEETGYVATERPWYKDAVAGKGEIVFTPPYMSYANHYILTTISQLQPDGETVFAYDIKMGDIQKLVSSTLQYDDEQIMIFDQNGTPIPIIWVETSEPAWRIPLRQCLWPREKRKPLTPPMRPGWPRKKKKSSRLLPFTASGTASTAACPE